MCGTIALNAEAGRIISPKPFHQDESSGSRLEVCTVQYSTMNNEQ